VSSAVETFVVALSRASKKANRYLARLQPADRDDIIASALAWCWEHRTEYPLDVSLDNWFVGAVRNAKRAFFTAEGRTAAADSLAEMQSGPGDDPAVQVEAMQAAEQLAASLSPGEMEVAVLTAQGYSRKDIERKLGRRVQDERKQLRKFAGLVPDVADRGRILRDVRARTVPAADSDEHRQTSKQPSIDRAIEQLDFPPPEMADCPPCWRCKYFDGYLPGLHKSVRLIISEPEVRQAVAVTEVRKIDIATRVRDGEVGFIGTGREA
jgi:DNA-directed RNA polymerase specialized sigma24 family protein